MALLSTLHLLLDFFHCGEEAADDLRVDLCLAPFENGCASYILKLLVIFVRDWRDGHFFVFEEFDAGVLDDLALSLGRDVAVVERFDEYLAVRRRKGIVPLLVDRYPLASQYCPADGYVFLHFEELGADGYVDRVDLALDHAGLKAGI